MKTRTTDHKVIRKWVALKKGTPAIIDHRVANGDKEGIRINFPGHFDEALLSRKQLKDDVTWNEFFKIFEEEQLVFIYDDAAISQDPSDWYRFDKRSNSK